MVVGAALLTAGLIGAPFIVDKINADKQVAEDLKEGVLNESIQKMVQRVNSEAKMKNRMDLMVPEFTDINAFTNPTDREKYENRITDSWNKLNAITYSDPDIYYKTEYLRGKGLVKRGSSGNVYDPTYVHEINKQYNDAQEAETMQATEKEPQEPEQRLQVYGGGIAFKPSAQKPNSIATFTPLTG